MIQLGRWGWGQSMRSPAFCRVRQRCESVRKQTYYLRTLIFFCYSVLHVPHAPHQGLCYEGTEVLLRSLPPILFLLLRHQECHSHSLEVEQIFLHKHNTTTALSLPHVTSHPRVSSYLSPRTQNYSAIEDLPYRPSFLFVWGCIFLIACIYLCICVSTHDSVHMWRSEGNLWESVLSFSRGSESDQWLGDKHPYLSHLGGLRPWFCISEWPFSYSLYNCLPEA